MASNHASQPGHPEPPLPPADPLYAEYLNDLAGRGVNVDEHLTYMEDLQLWFRLCPQPVGGGHPATLYRLDVLQHPSLPCDARTTKIEAFDTTEQREKISRGSGHHYLSFLLSRERTYEVVCDEKGFSKNISWLSQPSYS